MFNSESLRSAWTLVNYVHFTLLTQAFCPVKIVSPFRRPIMTKLREKDLTNSNNDIITLYEHTLLS